MVNIKARIKSMLLNTSPKADNAKEDFVLMQLKEFNKLNDNRFLINQNELQLCLDDNTVNTYFDYHYIYHPAWAARIIKNTAPEKHVDISSTLHFCSIISAFIKTEFYDYRPAQLNLSDLTSNHADLTDLPFETNSVQSLSCMHTVEHIGLGRYGDPVDPTADLKAIEELKRVCKVGGNLLIVVPVGKRKIRFNAHRIYNPFDMIDYMQNFELKSFALIDDTGSFDEHAQPEKAQDQDYACGCYWFVKQ